MATPHRVGLRTCFEFFQRKLADGLEHRVPGLPIRTNLCTEETLVDERRQAFMNIRVRGDQADGRRAWSFVGGREHCGSGIEAQTVRLLDAVNDRRQKSFRFRNAKFIKYLRPIGAGAVIAKSEIGFGRITCAFPGELEIKPVLAVKRGCSPGYQLRTVAAQPDELHALLAGIDPGPGALVMRSIALVPGIFLGD